MKIIVHCKGQNYGPYSEFEIRDLVKEQRFSDSLPAWIENRKSWLRLADLLGSSLSTSQVLPTIPAPLTPLPAMVLTRAISRPLPTSSTPASVIPAVPSATPPVLGVTSPTPARNMMIIINSDGQNYGPYTPEKVREFIRWGVFRMEDFAYIEGTKVWMRVVEALQGMAAPAQASAPAIYRQPAGPALVRTEDPTKSLDPKKTKIIVRCGVQKFGPYNLNQIRELLLSGKFKESDSAWSAAHNSWVTLGELLDQLRQHVNSAPSPSPTPRTQEPQPVQYQTPIQLLGSPLSMVPTISNVPKPAAPKRKLSGADVMSASSRNFGASI